MKDEIKEILDYLKSPNKDSFNGEMNKSLTYKQVKILIDCITNLQESYEKEAYLVDKYTRQITQEYENTRKQTKEKEKYKSRNEKIIRKISLYRMDDITMESNRILNDLLNIVLGEDKDENN